ncbi:MAG: HAMP domain-containing histidine kinase [Burkholderiaceae bacterium]|nr:HAMP domain-containing histidine kinase [Burkholderiaceae bacterium]
MLTGGLLRVARGTTRGAFESIDLGRLVGEVAEHLRNEARARGVEIEIGVTRDAVAQGDRSALWIVLVNLLRNAIRHGGATRVRVEWTDGRLRVRDDGRGFDAGRGPGLRSLAAASSEADTAGRDGSLGLGLSIVERVCEAAGWRLTIDSDAATGTRVELDLRSGDAAAPGR